MRFQARFAAAQFPANATVRIEWGPRAVLTLWMAMDQDVLVIDATGLPSPVEVTESASRLQLRFKLTGNKAGIGCTNFDEGLIAFASAHLLSVLCFQVELWTVSGCNTSGVPALPTASGDLWVARSTGQPFQRGARTFTLRAASPGLSSARAVACRHPRTACVPPTPGTRIGGLVSHGLSEVGCGPAAHDAQEDPRMISV